MATMTIKEIAEALANRDETPFNIILTPETVSALMWYAAGQAVTRYGNRVSKHLKGQRLRAEACRYRNMAAGILGKTDYPDVLRAPEYGDDSEFGSWDFEVETV